MFPTTQYSQYSTIQQQRRPTIYRPNYLWTPQVLSPNSYLQNQVFVTNANSPVIDYVYQPRYYQPNVWQAPSQDFVQYPQQSSWLGDIGQPMTMPTMGSSAPLPLPPARQQQQPAVLFYRPNLITTQQQPTVVFERPNVQRQQQQPTVVSARDVERVELCEGCSSSFHASVSSCTANSTKNDNDVAKISSQQKDDETVQVNSKRTRLSEEQVQVLRNFFAKKRCPNQKDCKRLAEQIGLTHNIINYWFRSERFRRDLLDMIVKRGAPSEMRQAQLRNLRQLSRLYVNWIDLLLKEEKKEGQKK